jgi:multidrug efflux pump
MNLSAPFIARPVATTLLTFGVAIAGTVAFFLLPVSPLPQVDFPTIQVMAQLPGASPATMASSVATPLERHLGVIADVTEMTSQSTVGVTRITIQFSLDRDINGAARDVQAAINAARVDLPTSLRTNPTYRKINPADAPVLILALTSETKTAGQLYDIASNVLMQKLSQVDGIGQVTLGGSSLPAVRVELNPNALSKYQLGPEDVRAALAAANANTPKGAIEPGDRRYQLYTNDQATVAAQYRNLVVAYRNGAPVALSELAEVNDSVENIRNLGLANGKPSVLTILYRQPGANIIDVVDRVRALLPRLTAAIPRDVDVEIVSDRTVTIRSSLKDVERTLVIAVCLVALVVFFFLRSPRASIIPAVAVPISLIGTFGMMYLLGYSLDNLSLMALTVATGFVVDDAIVVVENIERHIEAGMSRGDAALLGAREVGFTVMSMSTSLIAVFIPILLMGGIVGRLFEEFAITLSIAVMVSLIVSLTTTPMMASRILRPHAGEGYRHGPIARLVEGLFQAMLNFYARTLSVALRYSFLTVLILFATVAINIFLYVIIPKGFFPQQDTGRLIGGIQGDQAISFQSMSKKFAQLVNIVGHDPDVESVAGFTGGYQTNGGFVFVSLKPLSERTHSADQVIARLRRETARVSGARLFFQAVQDIRVGGRQSNSLYQYTLQSDDLPTLQAWAPRILDALEKVPILTDVNIDQQDKGLETDLVIDRPSAGRFDLNVADIDNTLYDLFGQRLVSTIYNALNQYHVVMEAASQYWQHPEILNDVYVSTFGGTISGTQSTQLVTATPASSSSSVASTTSGTPSAAALGTSAIRNQTSNAIAVTGHGVASTGSAVSTFPESMVPLAAFIHFGPGHTPLSVNHQGLFVASTISFNLTPGKSLSDAVAVIEQTMNRLGVPATIHGSFQGTARAFQASVANEPILILTALVTVYIVLGILYESYIHPITILSTLPSAGVGAVLALMLFHSEFSIISLVGVILLIGIVKKNAIMMIDFALHAERQQGMATEDAIYHACLLRFRPIMMTTAAALLGALPLAVGRGEGSELRQPLGISIVGGLIVSQALTLYTTPVIYLYLDRFRLWIGRRWGSSPTPLPEPGE